MLIVGEFLSPTDVERGGPFLDNTGKMFRAWLSQSGINPRDCQFTNVVNVQASSYKALVGPKELAAKGTRFVKRGEYLRAEFIPHLESLYSLINSTKPNLVLAVGDLALWALTDESSIKNNRGRVTPGRAQISGVKVLPTYSARQVIVEWPNKPILLADLDKARREDMFPEIRRPQRFIHLHPTLDDLESFFEEFIVPATELSVDIETKGTMITCVGFAPSPSRALVVPFFTESHKDGNYWRTAREEYIAWQWVKRVLRHGAKTFGQNFQFDAQHLWRSMGIKCPFFSDDTMLMHHSLYPELNKGLGFLASVYTDELSWKFMHKVAVSDKSAKRGDEQ